MVHKSAIEQFFSRLKQIIVTGIDTFAEEELKNVGAVITRIIPEKILAMTELPHGLTRHKNEAVEAIRCRSTTQGYVPTPDYATLPVYAPPLGYVPPPPGYATLSGYAPPPGYVPPPPPDVEEDGEIAKKRKRIERLSKSIRESLDEKTRFTTAGYAENHSFVTKVNARLELQLDERSNLEYAVAVAESLEEAKVA